jgi:hypothetical protein
LTRYHYLLNIFCGIAYIKILELFTTVHVLVYDAAFCNNKITDEGKGRAESEIINHWYPRHSAQHLFSVSFCSMEARPRRKANESSLFILFKKLLYIYIAILFPIYISKKKLIHKNFLFSFGGSIGGEVE